MLPPSNDFTDRSAAQGIDAMHNCELYVVIWENEVSGKKDDVLEESNHEA